MSLSNILTPNGYNLYCNSINGSIPNKSNCRVSVDPSSNFDPNIGGLIIPANSGESNSMPITFGPAAPYNHDPKRLFTIHDNYISIKKGRYFISFQLSVMSYDPGAIQGEGKIVQFLRKDDTIFMSAPICSCGMYNGYPLVVGPFNGFFWALSSQFTFEIQNDTDFALKYTFNNTTPVTIAMTSGFSLISLD